MNRHANLPSMTQPLFDKTEPRLAEVTFLEKNIKDLNRAILHLQKLNRYISEQVIETNENLKTKIVTELTPEYLFATSAYRNEYYKYLNTMNAISVRRKRLLNDLNLAKK